MDAFPWRDCYCLGVPHLDAQHRQLLELASRLRRVMAAGRPNGVLPQLLDELAVYSEEHFAAEDALIAASGHPDRALHRQDHDRLKDAVARFRAEFDAGRQDVAVELISFIGHWICDHIRDMDRRLIPPAAGSR